MNFFERQSESRRLSRLLVALFVLAVLAVVATIDAIVLVVAGFVSGSPPMLPGVEPGTAPMRWGLLTFTSLTVLGLIGLASLYKTMSLSDGGGVVAKSLGGVRISSDTRDPRQRRLLNVIEEMAIASGVPMPEVYLLEHESGINAFAAGHHPSNAAIAVTRGALDTLDRSELQGVIAHEFSHILNGDMRLNIRLIGLLFGLLVLALVARTVLRMSPHSSRGRRGQGVALVMVAAFATLLAGYVGLFFGRIIQAAISRSRESLADASAVQFTRDPGGLRGALVKIGALSQGSRLASPEVEEVAHMLFAPGMRRLFATHPSLVSRLRALDPDFDPSEFARARARLEEKRESVDTTPAAQASARKASESLATLPAAGLPQAIVSLVGNPHTAHVQAAQGIRDSLRSLEEVAGNPSGARALLLALAVAAHPQSEGQRLELVRQRFGKEVGGEVAEMLPVVASLRPEQRLPILLLAFPALRQLARESRQQILDHLREALVQEEGASLHVYVLLKLAQVWLTDELRTPAPARDLTLQSVAPHLQVLFSVLARFGHDSTLSAQRAYEAGMARLLPRHRPEYYTPTNWPLQLDVALTNLDQLQPAAKELLIEAMVRTITHDRELAVNEAELLRAVCASLHCPLPPLIEAPLPQGAADETSASSRAKPGKSRAAQARS